MVVTPWLKVYVPTCPKIVVEVVAPVKVKANDIEPEQLSLKTASVMFMEAEQTPKSVKEDWFIPGIIVGKVISGEHCP